MSAHDIEVAPPAGLSMDHALLALLADAYRTPTRHYHTLAHAWQVARWVNTAHAQHGFERVGEAYVAALFHDAVYDVTRKDNEAQSAALACAAIETCKLAVDADWVTRLIEKTATHGHTSHLTADEALFLDCDMSILGAESEHYRLYEEGVAREYLAHIPEQAYRIGRKRFIEKLLSAPRIFQSEYFYARLEERARVNLTLALAQG